MATVRKATKEEEQHLESLFGTNGEEQTDEQADQLADEGWFSIQPYDIDRDELIDLLVDLSESGGELVIVNLANERWVRRIGS